MARSAVFMPFDIKVKYKKLMRLYEEKTGEVLKAEWEFLARLLDMFERLEWEDVILEKKIDELKQSVEELKQLVLKLKGGGNYIQEILMKNLELLKENELLKQQIRKLEEEKKRLESIVKSISDNPEVLIEKMTARQIFRLMIKKVLDQIENEQLKKEVEKDLFNLEFALFKLV